MKLTLKEVKLDFALWLEEVVECISAKDALTRDPSQWHTMLKIA
jgi:hypothetical protein